MARVELNEGNIIHHMDQAIEALEDHANGVVDPRVLRNRRFGWEALRVTPGLEPGQMPMYDRSTIGRFMGYQVFRRENPPLAN